MKAYPRLSAAFCLAFLAVGMGCRKDTKASEVGAVAQDTMLMHDLAEANRNTAAASAMDNSLNAVAGARAPADTTKPAPSGSEILTSGPRPAPTKASDAPGGTNIPLDRSPASGLVRANRDPCNSPAAVDQRSCLNRSIAENDADLNRTYQELLAQARKSGGSELEDRFQQAQREWINQRDSECSAQTASENGKLWAKARGRCLADYSTKRTSELQRNLNNLRGQ
jgi:uncharacterized protein YecT (DUF1311 family)